jgi:hypothetical protein
MKQDVSGNTRRPVSIHVELNGTPKPPLHEFVQIDNSTENRITIHLKDCRALNLDFNPNSPFKTRYSNIDFNRLKESPEGITLHDSWQDNDTSSTSSNPQQQVTYGTSSTHTDARTFASTVFEPVEIPVRPSDVPLAKVRWRNPPPSARAKSAMHFFMQNGTNPPPEETPAPDRPTDASDNSTPEKVALQRNPHTLNTTANTDTLDGNDIPMRNTEGLAYDDSDTEPILQAVRTSIPPLHDIERARKRRPIYMVSAAAMLIMVGVVGSGVVMLNAEYNNVPVQSTDEALTIASAMPGRSGPPRQLPPPMKNAADARPAMAIHKSRTERSFSTTRHPATKLKNSESNQRTSNSSTDNLHLPRMSETATNAGNENTHPADSAATKVPISVFPTVTRVDAQQTGAQDSSTEPHSGQTPDAPVPAPAAQAEETTQMLPVRPTRDEVKQAMENIAPYVRNCKLDRSGKLLVELVVSGNTGKVISTEAVDAAFADSATERCISKVVKSVVLPVFQKETITIRYPFDL